MKLSPWALVLGIACLLGACAGSTDHFYTLKTLPEGERTALSAPLLHVRLDVSVPRLVDRSEMIIAAADNGIVVLDHERWAVPFADQVVQTLSRDLERRRGDVLVGDQRFDQRSATSAQIKVDIVRMTVARAGHASLDAHWRIVDAGAGIDELGGDSFDAPVNGESFAAVAQAYSQALSALAERLAQRLPAAALPQ